ncbi:hypothetical protein VTK73DRAFT_8681 [Phialemonium thermophilum]|uniref:Uncharacterized protein n=1 Tax=Phialemonium thermophilum TaxID=223376 RepID=A0ABR3W6Y9_9PEZI
MTAGAGQQQPPFQVTRFCRQYLQLEPVLTFPDGELLREEATQRFLYARLFAPGALPYPPPPRYQLRVLKEMVARIERSIHDWDAHGISDDLVDVLSRLMSGPVPDETTAARQKSYVTYYPSLLADPEAPLDLVKAITLLESRALISAAGTTGLRTWEAALHLGQYLCSRPGLVRGLRVLELGAGTGYLSILCAKLLGAQHVVASDGSDEVVDHLADNLFLNGLQRCDNLLLLDGGQGDGEGDGDREPRPTVQPMGLRWGHALVGTEEAAWNGGRRVDVVLGADVTYDAAVIPALVATLDELAALHPGVLILIAATERNRATFEAFLDACRGRRHSGEAFDVELVDFSVAPAEEQAGPFYSAASPIHICRLSRGHR